VSGEPGLAAGEKFVEGGGHHLPGKIGVAPQGNDAAKGLAFGDFDLAGAGVEFDDDVPGITGGIPIGLHQGGHGTPGAPEVGNVSEIEQFVGIGLQKKIAADFDLVADDGIDVIRNRMREALPFFPEPGKLLGERFSLGLIGAGIIEIAFDDGVGADGPVAALEGEGDVEIGEQVKAKSVGGADGRAFFGPAFALAALDVNVLGGLGREKIVAEFEVEELGGQRMSPGGFKPAPAFLRVLRGFAFKCIFNREEREGRKEKAISFWPS